MPIDIDPLAANGVPHWFSVFIRASAFSTDSLRIMAIPSRVDSLPAREVDVSILRSIIEHTDISAPPPAAAIKSAPPPPPDIKFRESHRGDPLLLIDPIERSTEQSAVPSPSKVS